MPLYPQQIVQTKQQDHALIIQIIFNGMIVLDKISTPNDNILSRTGKSK